MDYSRFFRRYGLPLLVIFLAAGMRLWQLTDLPPGLHHDAAFHGLNALQVLNGDLQPYFTGNEGNEPGFVYLLAAGRALNRSYRRMRLCCSRLSRRAARVSGQFPDTKILVCGNRPGTFVPGEKSGGDFDFTRAEVV